MSYESYHGRVNVAYAGPIWTNEELAERFGRKTIDGMIDGRDAAWIYEHARLAGSYARIALAQQEAVEAGVTVIQGAFGGGR